MAGAGCFSRFHFHRIFKALVGETAGEFKRRRGLEKAAGPDLSVAYVRQLGEYTHDKPVSLFNTIVPWGQHENF